MPELDVESARQAFFGQDPVAGDDALAWFIESFGKDALSRVLTTPLRIGSGSIQIEKRMAKLVAAIGDAARPHLVEMVRSGDWAASGKAAMGFAGLRGNASAEDDLIGILKSEADSSIDSLRRAIEALGYLGAHHWAYSLFEFAQFQHWGAAIQYRRPSEYMLGKLNHHVFRALFAITSHTTDGDAIRGVLGNVKSLRKVCKDVLGRGGLEIGDVRSFNRHLGTASADSVIQEWISDKDPFFQECGFLTLAKLRLDRTVSTFLKALEDEGLQSDPRRSASTGLADFCSRSAAMQLSQHIDAGRTNRVHWPFSTQYSIDVPWKNHDALIDEILNRGDEPRAQMLYSLARRQDKRAQAAEAGLNDPDEFIRGSSALACARFDPAAARQLLSGREREAASPMERMNILAAQVHAGHTDQIDQLHGALIDMPLIPILRPVWKREILSAFFVAEGPDSRRGKLWCDAASESDVRVKAETAVLFNPSRHIGKHVAPPMAIEPISKEEFVPNQKPPHQFDVFISHASEDKDSVVRPLYDALTSAGLRVWYDEATLKLGDSLRRKIDEGLSQSRFGVVILSRRFLEKEWPQRELDGLTARETVSGKKAILPVWHDVDGMLVARYSPPLADRLACRTAEGIDVVARKIREALQD